MRFLILLIALANRPTHTDIWIEPIAAPTTVPDVRFCYPDFDKPDMDPIPCPPIEIQGCNWPGNVYHPEDAPRCISVI